MLSIASYKQDYVDTVRGRIGGSLEAFAALRESVGAEAVAGIEGPYFANLVLALDHYFDHRARGQEGKDGNALNELRMLCNSLMHGDGKLVGDSQIKLDPKKSALGIAVGEPIVIGHAGFVRLAAAVFAEVEKRYP
ncbi:hypothetical protein [Devosia sp.]|uniref:hypothetical protein n=1 Tax=Devosia sp. TaxID=1871048 RepID=UPI003BAC042D